MGVSSTSKNHPLHHNYKSPKQFELHQSQKSLRALNDHWALPVYPVFEDEVKSVRRKIGQAKNRIKKLRRGGGGTEGLMGVGGGATVGTIARWGQ